MRYTLPVDYSDSDCVALFIHADLLPIITAQLLPLLEARLWHEDSYSLGYHAISEVFSQMTNNCLQDLIQEIRDFRGVKPDFASTPIEERTSEMYNSLNDSFAQLLALRGIQDDGWFTDTYATLTGVIQAQRGADQTDAISMWDTVQELIVTGASGGSILANIADLLGDTGGTAIEAGLLTTLVAIGASNAALMQQQHILIAETFTTLNSILFALRGATPPTDNLLQAIRGDVPADAERNIAEILI